MYASFKSVLRGNFFVPKCLYQGCRNKTQINQEINKKKKEQKYTAKQQKEKKIKIEKNSLSKKSVKFKCSKLTK